MDYFFFFLGKPFFIAAYDLAEIVDFFLDREVPAFFLLLMLR